MEVAKSYGILFDIPEALIDVYKSIGFNLAEDYHASGTWQLPIPATYVIKPDGVIHQAYTNMDFRKRLEPKTAVEPYASQRSTC
jgi:peroxiredoxin